MLLRHLKSLSRSVHFSITMSHRSPSDTPEGPCVRACARDLLGIGQGISTLPSSWLVSIIFKFGSFCPRGATLHSLPSPASHKPCCERRRLFLPPSSPAQLGNFYFHIPQILKASRLVQEPQIWASEVCTYRGFNCIFLCSAEEKVGPDACLLCSFREMAGCSTLSSEWENERMGKGWHRVGSCDT